MTSKKIRNVLSAAALAVAAACGGNPTNTGESTGTAACQNGTCAEAGPEVADVDPPDAAPDKGVGVACTPGDEALPAFPGFGVTEINIEDRATQCTTGICLAAYFQGRTSCAYGSPDCTTPGGEPVTTDVKPQLLSRSPSDAVYCSCHCDGPEGTGPFCACPGGFECLKLVDDIGLGHAELAGSYCIKVGTAFSDPTALASGPTCDRALHNCDDR
jgi:hypothetical protein